jgi:hypothetical protein
MEVGGWIILKRVFVFEGEEVKWIGVARSGDNWIYFLNTVLKTLV